MTHAAAISTTFPDPSPATRPTSALHTFSVRRRAAPPAPPATRRISTAPAHASAAMAARSYPPEWCPRHRPSTTTTSSVAPSIRRSTRASSSRGSTTSATTGTCSFRSRTRMCIRTVYSPRCRSVRAAKCCRTCRWCSSTYHGTTIASPTRPGRSTAASMRSRSCTRAVTWSVTASRCRTTPTTRAASTPITTSAGCRARPLRDTTPRSAATRRSIRPTPASASRRARLSTSWSAIPTRLTSCASAPRTTGGYVPSADCFMRISWCRTSPTGCTRRRPTGFTAPASTRCTRYYRMDTFEVGAKAGSYGCRPGGIYSAASVPNPCPLATNLDTIPVPAGNSAYSDTAIGLHKLYTGFKSRVNLTWKVTPDALVYGTWSQGFRPGGFNRGSGFVGGSSPLAGVFLVPIGFAPDVLTNKEFGWKTEWLEHRLQFNGAVYREDWKNVQIGIFDPGVTGNLTFTTNGPNYRVKGIETELVARVTPQFTVTGAASWNSSELVNSPALLDKSGNPITIANPYGAQGSPLAGSPPFQGNLRARYEWDFNNYNAFVQVAGTRQAHSFATTDRLSHELSTTVGQVGPSIAYDQPGFSTLDAAAGLAKDAWSMQFYGANLTDKRANLSTNYNQWIRVTTVNRPRTLGLTVSYQFKGQ